MAAQSQLRSGALVPTTGGKWTAIGQSMPGQLKGTPRRVAPKIRQKQRLLEKLSTEPGLTQAQQRQKLGQAQKEAAQQTAAFSKGIQRQALAAGTGFGGAQAEMQYDIAGQAQEAGAKAAADVQRQHEQLAAMQAADIDTQLKYMTALKRNQARHWAKQGVDTGAAVSTAAAQLTAAV